MITEGIICISENEKQSLIDKYEFSESTPEFPSGVSPEITGYDSFDWQTNPTFTNDVTKGNLVGDIYLDIYNGVIYVDVGINLIQELIMREYTVVEVGCFKELTPADVYRIVEGSLPFHNPLFEIFGLFKYKPSVTKSLIKRYEELGLNIYYQRIPNRNMQDKDYYEPEKHDYFLNSNLDASWEFSNPAKFERLEKSYFCDIVAFCAKLTSTQYSTYMLGFDEIEWDGKPVRGGTYGHKKAESVFKGGSNYLSNSLFISKIAYENKPLKAYISFEEKYKESGKIRDIIGQLGKEKGRQTYFAPESNEEREQLENSFRHFQNAIKQFKSDIGIISERLPYKLDYIPSEEIGRAHV